MFCADKHHGGMLQQSHPVYRQHSCCFQPWELQLFMQRVWALGPKRTGPNFLLSSAAPSISPSSSSALFSTPDKEVVRLSARQEKKTSSHPAQADIGGGYGGAQPFEDPALRPSESAEADTQSELSAKVSLESGEPNSGFSL